MKVHLVTTSRPFGHRLITIKTVQTRMRSSGALNVKVSFAFYFAAPEFHFFALAYCQLWRVVTVKTAQFYQTVILWRINRTRSMG
jgi:hypothetical protein